MPNILVSPLLFAHDGAIVVIRQQQQQPRKMLSGASPVQNAVDFVLSLAARANHDRMEGISINQSPAHRWICSGIGVVAIVVAVTTAFSATRPLAIVVTSCIVLVVVHHVAIVVIFRRRFAGYTVSELRCVCQKCVQVGSLWLLMLYTPAVRNALEPLQCTSYEDVGVVIAPSGQYVAPCC